MIAGKFLAAGAIAALALGVSATAASAAPHSPSTHIHTQLADRPDGGNGSPDPYWADDTMTRDMTITETGVSAGVYSFTASLTDAGTFTTVKGEQTPNQGAPYTGDLIKSAVTGWMTGYANFSFTATSLPNGTPNAGVATYENDHGTVSADDTSTWYELAFPGGTVFGGTGIGNWSWSYGVNVKSVTFTTVWVWKYEHHQWVHVKELVPVVHVSQQHWVDAYNNNYGDSAGDGNITG